jgi:hypothetical protein
MSHAALRSARDRDHFGALRHEQLKIFSKSGGLLFALGSP